MSSAGDSTASNQTFGQNASIKLPQLIGSMSISPSGRDVVLGSKEGLHIIDLDSLHSPPRELPHRTPWEVADVQWSPFAERDNWVVSTSNQKALVWNLAAYGQRDYIEHVLHGHSRAITDINFSAWSPDKLATCAVDSFVHCWDLRSPARPVTSFSDWFAGATQVKWSRQDEHVIASSHDKSLHIWDDRMGAYPTRTFEAHDAKIYGIDWNRFEPSKIVTCSLDKTIKFWDTNNEENRPERTIETSFPVWRARHTPFGWGLMVIPQRGDGDLHLYDRRPVDDIFQSGRVEPVHVFKGHKGQVKEFLWRPTGTVIDGVDHRDFQLVSGGTDRDLKLHAVPKEIFLKVGYEKGVSRPQNLRFTRRGARYRTFHVEPTDSDAIPSLLSRHDSIPAQSQFQRARGRQSTNIGMSTLPMAQFKGWLQAGKRGRRTDMHGKGMNRPNTDPISWMKNVKMADALADEITQVGERFKKVDFEAVNMSQRRATMSLQSPWGEGSSSVYTRIDLKFPKGYPKHAQPILYVARTNSISSEIQKKLTADLQQIAGVHASRGRGCLEAVVRYLLREQTMEQVINWMTRDSLTDSKILDINMSQDASDDSDDEQLDSVPNLTNSSANVRVPLAKGCAGLWAENGKLVCFFLPKGKEPASFLSTLGTGKLDDSESSKLFGGFGKFQVDSPSRKAKDAPNIPHDDSDSNSSSNSSVFSSSVSSSDSSEGFEERARFVPWQRTTLDSLQRGKSADGSQKSTLIDGIKSDDLVKNTVISIHDLSDLLPAKQSLAQSYKIRGDTLTVCQHNAEVSSRYALYEQSMLWRLAANVLVPNIPQQSEMSIREDREMSSLLKQVSSIRDGKLAVQNLGNMTASVHSLSRQSFSGGIFGHTYLIPVMMQYLDRLCDIQMLAMLSAVFLQSKVVPFDVLSKPNLTVKRGSKTVISLIAEDSTDSLRLGSSDVRPGGLRHGATFNIGHNQFQRTDPSQDIVLEMSTSVPMSTMHTGFLDSTHSSSGTPSVVAHDPSGVISAIHSTVVSVAGSPENHRISRRSEGSVALPNAIASLHALTRSRPPSPPPQSFTKESSRAQRSSKSLRASPDENFFNDARSRLKSSLSLVNVSGYGSEINSPRHGADQPKPILKNHKDVDSEQRPRRKLRTRLIDPSQIKAGQSAASADLLSMTRDCLSYLQQYTQFLDIWQLWVQKAELQHILARTNNILVKIASGRSSDLEKSKPTLGLEIRRCCPQCGHALAAIEKNGVAIGWHCVSGVCVATNSRLKKKQECSICDVAIDGLSLPCLECGHLTCYNCAQEWFVPRPTEDRKGSAGSIKSILNDHERDRDGSTCPAGCGCSCPALTTITVPEPTANTEFDEKATVTPTTPRSEDYQDAPNRQSGVNEHRSHRVQSVNGPDSALNALMALNMSSRHRSISAAQNSATAPGPSSQNTSAVRGSFARTRENSVSIAEELLPWETAENPTLGRGVGGGLSRGLSNKGSDATIRRSGR